MLAAFGLSALLAHSAAAFGVLKVVASRIWSGSRSTRCAMAPR
jgi:threonine/homoserine/homoserine lactone efflux protein